MQNNRCWRCILIQNQQQISKNCTNSFFLSKGLSSLLFAAWLQNLNMKYAISTCLHLHMLRLVAVSVKVFFVFMMLWRKLSSIKITKFLTEVSTNLHKFEQSLIVNKTTKIHISFIHTPTLWYAYSYFTKFPISNYRSF